MIIFNLKTKFTDDDPWVLNYKKVSMGSKHGLAPKVDKTFLEKIPS